MAISKALNIVLMKVSMSQENKACRIKGLAPTTFPQNLLVATQTAGTFSLLKPPTSTLKKFVSVLSRTKPDKASQIPAVT